MDLTPQYQALVQTLKRLPGLGSTDPAEKVALHLLVESPASASTLIENLNQASSALGPCKACGNLAEEDLCSLCASDERDHSQLCIVESVTGCLLSNGQVFSVGIIMYCTGNWLQSVAWVRKS